MIDHNPHRVTEAIQLTARAIAKAAHEGYQISPQLVEVAMAKAVAAGFEPSIRAARLASGVR